MRKVTVAEMRILKEIASFYGLEKVHFGLYARWNGDEIFVRSHHGFRHLVSDFCHELAHYINWKTGKWPLYHNPENFGKMIIFFPTAKKLARYSLRAELYTEKVAKELCRFWFPNIKYKLGYKNDVGSFEFLHGYFRRDLP